MADVLEACCKILCNESLCKCLATDCCSICQSIPCHTFCDIGSCCCKLCEGCLSCVSLGSMSGGDCNCKCKFAPKCSECDEILYTTCIGKIISNTSDISEWCDWACGGISRAFVKCCEGLNVITCFGIPIIDINDNVYYDNPSNNNYNRNYNSNIVVVNEMGSSGSQNNTNRETKKADNTAAITSNAEISQNEIQINLDESRNADEEMNMRADAI